MSSSIIKHLRNLCIAAVAVAGMGSCVQDKADISYADDGSETAMVRLSIFTPGSTLPKTTRNATPDECTVERVKVVVMEKEGGQYIYKYWADGQQISQSTEDSAVSTFSAKLLGSPNPLKLFIVANYNDAFTQTPLSRDMTESEVVDRLTDTFSDDIKGQLPMYGEVELPSLNAEVVNTVNVTMLRSIARVDVNNSIDPDFSDAFSMERVYIYRANDKVRLIPDPSAMSEGSSMTVSTPTIPSGSGQYPAYYEEQAGGTASFTQVYLPESAEITSNTDRTPKATCIVIGGIYEDDDELSYYRIDFNSGIDGHPFGQVLRNHKYVFNIKNVNGRGWPDPDSAANNEATAIIAEMQVWNESTTEMYFSDNDNYLGISSRHIVLDYFKGAEETAYIQSTVPFRIQAMDANGSLTGPVISSVGENLDNDFFNVAIKADDQGRDNTYSLVMTALADNDTDDNYVGMYRVFTDFWTFDVTVEQRTYLEMYRNRYINVLTVTSLPGDLGNNDGTYVEGVSGDAMRKILENRENFSPSGTVPVAGIIVHDFSNTMISSSDTYTMSILEKLLTHVDVVHLPMDCTPSVEASKLIYDWVSGSDNTVLMLGMDNETTNANLSPYFVSDGTWLVNDGKVYEVGTAFFEEAEWATVTGGNEYFFTEGPFGKVTPNMAPMGFVSSHMGYNNGYISETTVPILIVTNGDDNHQKMTHGVNKELGVFYFGDSEIFTSQGEALSAQAKASGEVATEFDSLLGNIWAWTIEKVITGNIR